MVNEYGMKDLSPSSMMDLLERMYNDVELASKYEWNATRRQTATPPKAHLHNKGYLCLAASETFEEKDCHGVEHIRPLKDLDVTSMFEEFIANWIKIE